MFRAGENLADSIPFQSHQRRLAQRTKQVEKHSGLWASPAGGGGLSLWDRAWWGGSRDIWVLIPEALLICCLNLSSNVALLVLKTWMDQPNE